MRTSATNLGQRFFLSFREGIGGVAIGAAQIAGGKTDENARQPGEGAFALQAQIDFVDDEGTDSRLQFSANERENGNALRSDCGWTFEREVDYFLSNDSVVLMKRLTCQAAVLAAVLVWRLCIRAARAQSLIRSA